MAEQDSDKINRFDGNLNTEFKSYHVKDNEYTHARNATNEFTSNRLETEPANKHCIDASYPIIGYIYITEDQWLIFSTDDVASEVGLFKEMTCEYSVLSGNFNCLGLNRKNLITGVARQNFDCSYSVYWSDTYLNPDRTLNITNIPYLGTLVTDLNGCQSFVPSSPLTVDCSKLKLNRSIKVPCIHVTKGASGGSLLNGSYYATIAYVINGQKVTDYFNLSNVASLFSHENIAGSLDIFITGLDDSFSEYELVVVAIVNQQTIATRVGLYSTNQQRVSLDIISTELPPVPLEYLPVHNPLMDKSKAIVELNDHMLRIAPRSKFDFNYQPLANQIRLKWVCVEYPADYYRNGGENPSFQEDENYAAFIQWEYEDSDVSSSYHVPGRPPLAGETAINSSINAIENVSGATAQQFEVVNTASITSLAISPIGDGGYQIAEGDMGYYQTSELYPQDKPLVWGNLCGKNIRHHKFPERGLHPRTNLYSDTAVSPILGPVVRVMAIKAVNIQAPLDNLGNTIPNIVGYRLLRGSREGNKTIIAKGIVNNMFEYNLLDGSGKTGLYQNYPYNDIHADPFISSNNIPTSTNFAGTLLNAVPNTNVAPSYLTFHSPDTNFRHPYLSAKELKIYGSVQGNPVLQFKEPNKHPKNKFLTNLAFFVASIAGIGYAVLKLNGKRSVKYLTPTRVGTDQEVIRDNRTETGTITNAGYLVNTANVDTYALGGTFAGGPIVITGGVTEVGSSAGTSGIDTEALTNNSVGAGTPDSAASAAYAGGIALVTAANTSFDVVDNVYNSFGDFVQALAGGVNGLRDAAYSTTVATALSSPFVEGGPREYTYEGGDAGAMGSFFKTLQAIPLFTNYWGQGTDQALELLMNFSQWQQYALQQYSHCFYDSFSGNVPNQYRYFINNAQYLGSSIQDADANFRVNNLYRASTVLLNTVGSVSGLAADDSKQTLQTIGGGIHANPTGIPTIKTATSFYAALKLRLRNQYGQIGDVKQIPIGCVNQINISLIDSRANIFTSPVIFGGDIYVTRYTEKNTMFFFNEWLYDQPNGYEYNYLTRRMLQYPIYWADSRKFDTGDFLQGIAGTIGGAITNLLGGGNTTPVNFQNSLPSGFRALDRSGLNGIFVVKQGYYYLFCSGVRDFYVDSEVNVGYRDWGNTIQERHYDEKTFTSLSELFDSNPHVIKVDNFYKYDYSLSVTKSFINFASWAQVQPPYYDPTIAATCYIKHPKRIIWSLPQQFEQIRDNWRIFLANNYRDFRNNVTTLQSIGFTGADIFFEAGSPIQIQGVETLKTGAGTTLTIGDGAFLSQAAQSLTNADRPYEYGSCQNIRSVVNTPAGLFWISQNQGKIFVASEGLMNIAMYKQQEWLALYLPYFLLIDFPTFELKDNAVAGIDCQSVYDNRNMIVYFCKKDYKLREDITDIVTYVSGNDFLVNGILPIKLGNPAYFEDASWTLSYDLKRKGFLSYHDWHPNLVMPSKVTFSSVKDNGIWKHSDVCDKYCNYYGIDYPFEVEYFEDTILDVDVLQSIEYQLEVYKYADNCYDKYLFLNENFDEVVVYNNEQISGLLRLINTPFNDPWAIVNYPIYNLSSIDILFSKVEQKYRINQFSDMTDDRGEFTNARRMLWITDASGYKKTLNPVNLNYNKSPFQRKPFRNYMNSVFLRKKVCDDALFIFNFSISKNIRSIR